MVKEKASLTEDKDLSDFLHIGEVASVLQVTPNTLRAWDRAGKLTAVRHPKTGRRLWPAREIEELIRNAYNERRKRLALLRLQQAEQAARMHRPLRTRARLWGR